MRLANYNDLSIAPPNAVSVRMSFANYNVDFAYTRGRFEIEIRASTGEVNVGPEPLRISLWTRLILTSSITSSEKSSA